METSVVKHAEKIQVTCKDGRILFYDLGRHAAVRTAIRTDIFVEIEGVMVNRNEIKYIEKMPDDYDVLIGLNHDQRNKAIAEFRKSKDALGMEPSRKLKLKKIAKILHCSPES